MEGETPEEFRTRMLSLQHIRGGRTRPLEKVVTRSEMQENKTDAGARAKMTINEDRDVVQVTSDNRNDVHVFGAAAGQDTTGGEL
jgi:hypothetical protein